MSSAPAGLHRLLLARERGIVTREDALAFQRSLHFPAHFASKLNVEHTYEGHNGCVNRLGWNADGSLLVSGSDDRRALIWHYPDVERTPLALSTEHRANIFGCQFLPCTGDRRIVTGAMDDTVQLHDLEASPAAAGAAAAARAAGRQGSGGGSGGGGGVRAMHRRTAASSAHLQLVTPRTKVYLSHKDRVKDVKVEPMNPHNFWSGGEDGDVRQYDTRVPNQDKWESPTVFVQVRDGHRTVQVKSLDINKAHPHLMAVAGSDPYIRLYDRRKLGTGHWKRRGATPAVMLLAPPHMPLARHGRAHATYVSFSNRGDKVVTTYHGDHAYCFDITAAGDMAALFPQPPAAAPRQLPGRLAGGRGMGPAAWGGGEAAASGRCSSRDDSSPGRAGWSGRSGSGGSGSSVQLPSRAEEAKARGNAATFERQWAAAVKAFSEALYFAPGAPVLYAMRAEALLRRGWVGDAALALRDCDTAAALDEGCSRAFLSRIQALQALQQYQCALTAVDEYRRRFPGRADADVAKLMSQLRASVEERRRLYEARRQQQERRRVQRAAEALARTPRRVATSPPPRGRRPRTADAGAAAGTSTGAAGAGAAATSPWRSSGPKAGPGAAAAAAAAAAERTAGAAAEAAEAATEPTTNNAAAERLAADGAAPMDATEPEVGPPPPPPSPPPYPATHLPDASPTIAAAAAGAPAAGPSSAAEPLDQMDDGAEPPAAARTAAAAVNGVAAAAVSAGVVGPPGCDSAPPGPSTPGEAEGRPEGVWEEAEEADGRPNDSGNVAAGDDGDEEEVGEEAEDGEDQDEGEEDDAGEGPARGRSYGEYGSEDEEDDELEMLSREDDGVEQDPDLELFLQYYAQAMELASSGTSSGSGASASGGTGTDTGVSTLLASSRALGGEPQGSGGGSGGRGQATPRAAAARHVPGAWGGSAGGRRMLQRYVGQCNVQTDIKEVNFVGSDDRVVAAGSDCGRVFLYDADSGAVLRALPADEDVANCVQCHPTLPVLATSGIENVIRLWSPRDAPPAAAAVSELEDELASVVERNQARMKEGPTVFRPSVLQDALQENPQLLHLFMSQLYGRGIVAGRGARAGVAGTGAAGGGGGENDEEEDEDGPPEVSCRMA